MGRGLLEYLPQLDVRRTRSCSRHFPSRHAAVSLLGSATYGYFKSRLPWVWHDNLKLTKARDLMILPPMRWESIMFAPVIKRYRLMVLCIITLSSIPVAI